MKDQNSTVSKCNKCDIMKNIGFLAMDQPEDQIKAVQCIHSRVGKELDGDWDLSVNVNIDDISDSDLSYKIQINQEEVSNKLQDDIRTKDGNKRGKDETLFLGDLLRDGKVFPNCTLLQQSSGFQESTLLLQSSGFQESTLLLLKVPTQ